MAPLHATRRLQTPKPSGFTLIEVLIALLILSIMAAMAWRGVDGMARARDVAQDRLERTLMLQSVMAQWQADLQSIVDTQAVPALGFDGASLRLTRSTPQGVQVVLWSLRGQRWERWAGPAVTTVEGLQEQWMQTLQFQGRERGQLTMIDGVQRLRVYCFRGATWSNCQSTGDLSVPSMPAPAASDAAGAAAVAAASLHQTLPAGVRLELVFAPGSGYNGSLLRDVDVPGGV
jgi:general secretion pathway protein J